jgi:CheY-like chemotaxis protein
LLTRAFELFVQGERGLDRSQGGLGIGLTLVRRLAELHGGPVTAESAGSGQGATFTVRLPGVDAPAIDRTANSEGPLRHQHELAIVEDNDDARMSLRMLLELEGHTVHEAAEGGAGVPLIAGNPAIAVAFIDIGLPGMSGYDIARAVRARRGSTVRLVAMSGYGGEQDIAKGLAAGFDAYIVKPADISALRPEIARA